jgi:sulfur carrier protein
MTITVNGKERELSGRLTVGELLDSLELDAVHVAVELNRAILPKERFAETSLANGDRLEIVQFVGGG